jgi:hypothetical protein
MTTEAIKVAVAALQSRFEELCGEREQVGLRLLEYAIRHQAIQKDIDGCIAGAQALGEEIKRVQPAPALASQAANLAYVNFQNGRNMIAQQYAALREFFKIPTGEEPSAETEATDARANMPRIADIIHERLDAAGPSGSKAADIRSYILKMFDVDIHDKTVSMTLNRLQKEGTVRREGHIWFSASQEVEKPGEVNAGPQ